jgi:endonuclease/exonuclease/phosphatase family metal-dependent hydrolase
VRRRTLPLEFPAVLMLVGFLCWLASAAAFGNSVSQMEFLGEARLVGGLQVDASVVGGLSGITYDAERGVYYAVSDDPSGRSPARFYTLEIDLGEGRLARDGVRVLGKTLIRDRTGGPMPELTVDPEGIALLDHDTLFISSEGQIRSGVPPFVRRFSLDGSFETELELPDRYRPDPEGDRGPRHNFGFESLTLSPDRQILFTALENALLQDGAQAALAIRSPSRLLEFDTATGMMRGEYLYLTEPVAYAATLPDGLEVAGLVDLLALDETSLLSMERSFSMGPGNVIWIFEIGIDGATDVSRWPALSGIDLDSVIPVRKELLLDLRELGIYLDNLEGMTLGPNLADGRQTVILVSDDNFNPVLQVTQFLAFAIDQRPLTVTDIQGAGHRSPLEGRWVYGIVGVVTLVRPGEGLEFWVEALDPDDDPQTSEGVLVKQSIATVDLRVGDEVEIAGLVRERQRPGELSTTWIEAMRLERVGRGRTLPSPVRIDPQGRRVPTEVVDDDGLQYFEPQFDGLDFWESLEGMRITIPDGRVIDATNQYGELSIDGGHSAAPAVGRTAAGGLLLQPGDLNPERLVVWDGDLPATPMMDVGARFLGELAGVVDYRFGRYGLQTISPLPDLQPTSWHPERTELRSGEHRLTVATFNVLNLTYRDGEDRFQAVATTLVDGLGSPDLIALQEIQDDSGSADDSTVSAGLTLRRLVEAVQAAGGPVYESRVVDPENNQDGGRPGSNIRVAFLFNPRRVDFVDRGQGGATDAVQVLDSSDDGILSLSPGRLVPMAPAFAGDLQRGFSPSRKPVVGEVVFGDERLVLINNHWASKRADDPTFGEIQPPRRRSEDQRSQQARLVADFVRQIEAKHPGTGVVVLGDLNEQEFRTPLAILGAAGLENLVLRLPFADRYSFNFQGNSQLLDHILINRSLQQKVSARCDIVHRNADFAHSRSASDHDPILVELDFAGLR